MASFDCMVKLVNLSIPWSPPSTITSYWPLPEQAAGTWGQDGPGLLPAEAHPEDEQVRPAAQGPDQGVQPVWGAGAQRSAHRRGDGQVPAPPWQRPLGYGRHPGLRRRPQCISFLLIYQKKQKIIYTKNTDSNMINEHKTCLSDMILFNVTLCWTFTFVWR